jgi:hypothetical protein
VSTVNISATAPLAYGTWVGNVFADYDENLVNALFGESGIEGWQVFADLDGDGTEDDSDTTDSGGNYGLAHPEHPNKPPGGEDTPPPPPQTPPPPPPPGGPGDPGNPYWSNPNRPPLPPPPPLAPPPPPPTPPPPPPPPPPEGAEPYIRLQVGAGWYLLNPPAQRPVAVGAYARENFPVKPTQPVYDIKITEIKGLRENTVGDFTNGDFTHVGDYTNLQGPARDGRLFIDADETWNANTTFARTMFGCSGRA